MDPEALISPTLAAKMTDAAHYLSPVTPEERLWLKRVDGYRWSHTQHVTSNAVTGYLTITVAVR